MSDCETLRRQLLELPADDFDALSEHLDQCPSCRALAHRILDLEAHVTETFDAALAAARPRVRRPTRWLVPALIAVAAAASLLLALSSPSTPPSPTPVESTARTPDAQLDNLVRLGVGRSAVLQLPERAVAAYVVDPTVAEVVTLGRADRLQVMARTTGRTAVHVQLASGEDRKWWVSVAEDATVDPVSDVDEFMAMAPVRLRLLVADRHLLELERIPVAIAVTDPQIVEVSTLGTATRVSVDGLREGTTDIIIQFGPNLPIMQYVVTVVP